jgi:hypothetical protein
MTTPQRIAHTIVWKSSFERKRRLRRIYNAIGSLVFVGMAAGAVYGVWRMFR